MTTYTARSVDQAMELLRTRAQDGDTVRLVWPAVESTALGLGLEVMVVVGDGYR